MSQDVYISPQAHADSAGAHAERSYELWRAWANEYEVEATEERLQVEGVTRSPLPFAAVRGRWVVLGGLLLTGLAALFLHIVSVFTAVHGA